MGCRGHKLSTRHYILQISDLREKIMDYSVKNSWIGVNQDRHKREEIEE